MQGRTMKNQLKDVHFRDHPVELPSLLACARAGDGNRLAQAAKRMAQLDLSSTGEGKSRTTEGKLKWTWLQSHLGWVWCGSRELQIGLNSNTLVLAKAWLGVKWAGLGLDFTISSTALLSSEHLASAEYTAFLPLGHYSTPSPGWFMMQPK